MRKYTLHTHIVLLLLFLSSCEREKNPSEPVIADKGVLILNEGNFGWGNAEIGFYNTEKESYEENIFERVNKRPLGDVLQSALVHKEEIYLVLNNSETVEVVDKKDFTHKRTLKGFVSPRYIAAIADTEEAFVTDIYANKVYRVHLYSGDILAEILLHGWLEHIVPLNTTNYALCNLTGKKVYIISSETNRLEDSLAFTGELSVLQRVEEDVFVLERIGDEESKVWKINSLGVRKEVFSREGKIKLFAMANKDKCYFVQENRMYEWKQGTGVRELTALSPSGTYYAMQYNSFSKQVWLTDVRNYVRKGKVLIISEEGYIDGEFEAGNIPNGFVF